MVGPCTVLYGKCLPSRFLDYFSEEDKAEARLTVDATSSSTNAKDLAVVVLVRVYSYTPQGYTHITIPTVSDTALFSRCFPAYPFVRWVRSTI